MIYKKVTFEDFEKVFKDYDRANNFPNTLRNLFDYLDDLSEDLPEGYLELDVISLCCDFSEYNLEGLIENYGDCDEYHGGTEKFIEDLSSSMTVIDCENGYYLVSEQ